MKTLRCLIVDDEELARTLVATFVKKMPNLLVVGEAKNPIEAMQILAREKVDLMFLDIQMPELTGIEFLQTIPQKPLVIFTTAYSEYALQSYELDVVDYLLKPFNFQRFATAINKAISRMNPEKTEATTQEVKQEKEIEKTHLLVKSEHKVFRIPLKDLEYIQGMREYVGYHYQGQRILSLNSLKSLEHELPTGQFIRIHKSYIVAIDKVKALEGNMVHIGDITLPIGASYRDHVKQLLFEL